jgi:hypothetical protein
LIDLLGSAPGWEVAGADLFGLLGEGKTAANVFSGIVAGGAIVGGPKIVDAAQGPCGCQ